MSYKRIIERHGMYRDSLELTYQKLIKYCKLNPLDTVAAKKLVRFNNYFNRKRSSATT